MVKGLPHMRRPFLRICNGLCPGSIPDEIATKGNSSWELPVTSPNVDLL